MLHGNRRRWLKSTLGLGVAATAGSLVGQLFADDPAALGGCTLSIGTYAMQGVPLEKAIAAIGEIGFDGVELAVMPSYSADPATLNPRQRKDARAAIERQGLRLTALMEHLLPTADDTQHRQDLPRLRRALELARDLGDDSRRPLLQTVLGGGDWEGKKAMFRDRLGDWLAAANEAGVVIAIKPHRGGAMSQPAEAVWLIEQLGKPERLRMVYDYSHYAFRDLGLEETIRAAAPYTAHVAIKDAVQHGGKVSFLLPGEQNTHYPRLFSLLYQAGYRGDFCCEVSSMVSNQPLYDPLAAAKVCYRNMAAALKASQARRV